MIYTLTDIQKIFLVAFIALALIIVILTAFFVLFPIIAHLITKKNHISSYGRKIYKIALHNDYYLINRLLLKTMDGTSIDIDHLLCGNKFIYVINDAYIDGELYGKINDRTWIKSIKNKKEVEQIKIDNLLFVNKKRIELFSQITNLDKDFFVNIVLVNDNCKIEGFENTIKNTYLIHMSELKRLISSLEKSNIGDIKDNQMRRAIIDIAKLNERKHK